FRSRPPQNAEIAMGPALDPDLLSFPMTQYVYRSPETRIVAQHVPRYWVKWIPLLFILICLLPPVIVVLVGISGPIWIAIAVSVGSFVITAASLWVLEVRSTGRQIVLDVDKQQLEFTGFLGRARGPAVQQTFTCAFDDVDLVQFRRGQPLGQVIVIVRQSSDSTRPIRFTGPYSFDSPDLNLALWSCFSDRQTVPWIDRPGRSCLLILSLWCLVVVAALVLFV